MGSNKQNSETNSLLKKTNVSEKWNQNVFKLPYVKIIFSILLLGAIIFYILCTIGKTENQGNANEIIKSGGKKFYIDYENNEFIKDGKVFRYASGSLNYFRVPRPYWRDRIQKMKAAGLNAVSVYIEWSFHEPYSGVYVFEGQADFEHFLTILKEENMLVLLRPGPYIAAERDLMSFTYIPSVMDLCSRLSNRNTKISYVFHVHNMDD